MVLWNISLSFFNHFYFRWSFGVLLWELATMGKRILTVTAYFNIAIPHSTNVHQRTNYVGIEGFA